MDAKVVQIEGKAKFLFEFFPQRHAYSTERVFYIVNQNKVHLLHLLHVILKETTNFTNFFYAGLIE